MDLKSLLPKRQKDSGSFLRLYVTTAIFSIVIIVLLSGFSFYRLFSGFVIKSAEEDSAQLCHLLFDRPNTLKNIPGPGEEFSISKDDLSQLDHTMRELLHPFNIIKVKIYNAKHRIIYSTEPSLIGMSDDHNLRLKNALAGNVDAKLVTRDRAHDLANEPLMDVDVVETYVPISSSGNLAEKMYLSNSTKSGTVLGSFEIYVNVTKYRDQIRTGVIVMTIITVAVLAAVFGFSYILIRRKGLQLDKAHAKLEKLAITDVLTGIGNRGYVMSRGEDEFARAERNRGNGTKASMLCCIMLDIDHFKNVNDTKGHPAGDEVLREVANRMRKCVRPYDIVGRYGGEEFLLLLPDTLFEEGVSVAERIRNDIRKETFKVGEDEIRVSISLGISCLSENDRKLDDLLKRADEGLYKAKHAGRDRVEWVYDLSDAAIFA